MNTPHWLQEPALQQFFASTRAAGGEARAVGGAVRDFLLGMEGGDVDVASTLPPERTLELAAQCGWKAIPTGIDHGTVTLMLPTRTLEVTTLRRDVTTDGRRATVAYTDNWQEDAARRDFTMNALYMAADGTLSDFFGGQADLAAQRVVFIGDASTRIAEDGLRMLRYFRFLATHGQPPADEAALAAITQQAMQVEALSGERVANEMRKMLAAENPAYALRLMQACPLAPRVFGRAIDPSRMIRLRLLEGQADYQTSVWARVLVLLALAQPTEALAAIDWLQQRWKLARHERKQLQQLAQLPALNAQAPRHVHTRILRCYGAPVYLDGLLMQAALTPGMEVAPWVQLAHDFTPPTFPITAQDLLAQGMQQSKALGDRLSLLERTWEESDYTLGKAELLQRCF